MRFQPGQSGNPAGRPPGSPNQKTLALEALLMEAAEETVKNLLERAKDGDPAAVRLVMARALPTGRNRPVAIDLPVIREPENVYAAMEVVTAALAAGKLTIAEASGFINLIDRMLRLCERVRKIEQARLLAAAVAAQLAGAAIASAPEDDADAGEVAAAAAAQAAQTGGETARDALYFPVNDESCRHETAPSGAERAGDIDGTPGNPAGGAEGDGLYFPVNKAA